MDKPIWMWAGFFGIVVILLILDLGVLHRKERDISIRESLLLSVGYIIISLSFGSIVYYYLGNAAGRDFLTSYFIEKSLSMDNILIMSMVFSHFSIPRRYQHRVLFWGVLGVILLRGVMIGMGAVIIQRFHIVLYLFGAFLVVTGIRMLLAVSKEEKTLEENKLLVWLKRHIAVTHVLHGSRFLAWEANMHGKLIRKATPLLLVLLFIELADIVFALDSVPAVFAITTDSFVVYTSNIFAILGLRALYFALAAMLHRFAYLKYGLAAVLVFIGAKIFIAPYLIISSGSSLAITLILLLSGLLLSLYKTRSR